MTRPVRIAHALTWHDSRRLDAERSVRAFAAGVLTGLGVAVVFGGVAFLGGSLWN